MNLKIHQGQKNICKINKISNVKNHGKVIYLAVSSDNELTSKQSVRSF